ncbi:unnamed protein product [Moneuplotes crassus]|uniref:Uncharacterized protein n=1 Tax=Euplotes crassus TaxID=5936 RepID=A0AAD1UHZ8_EUPCR|nr:unnamed protein product [Moneuplotes crassus]
MKKSNDEDNLSSKSHKTQCSESDTRMKRLEKFRKFKSKGDRCDKEYRISKFLTNMRIEQTHPGDFNFMRAVTCRDNTEMTPTLSLGKNSLLLKRSKKLRPICNFSECINYE